MPRRSQLQPADLRGDRYVDPVATLKPAQLWCGWREVWTAYHGSAGRYHVMVDGGLAACRAKENWGHRSVIVLSNLVPIGQVPAHMRCARNGCRQYYAAFLA